MKLLIPTLSLLLIFCACDTTGQPQQTEQAEAPDAIASRVSNSLARLNATHAGRQVAASIKAHGGLDKWYRQSPLYFHFNYVPTDGKGSVRNSFILNDYRNARAVHQHATQAGVSYGFDGQDAWQLPADSEPGVSPRFWSLTPYYFVGLPFVLADEGINFEQLAPTDLDGITYEPIKVTYQSGTGDADEDYYILYLNPESNELDALNYIVSYRGFFEDGQHLPEKLMRLKGKTTVAGIMLPTGYLTSWSDAPGVNITDIEINDYEFRPDTDASAFDRPAGAKVVNDLPGD